MNIKSRSSINKWFYMVLYRVNPPDFLEELEWGIYNVCKYVYIYIRVYNIYIHENNHINMCIYNNILLISVVVHRTKQLWP